MQAIRVWKLQRGPLVVQIDVHIGHYHTLCYSEGQRKQAAVEIRVGTKLAEWFQKNKKNACAIRLQYADFSQPFNRNMNRKF